MCSWTKDLLWTLIKCGLLFLWNCVAWITVVTYTNLSLQGSIFNWLLELLEKEKKKRHSSRNYIYYLTMISSVLNFQLLLFLWE